MKTKNAIVIGTLMFSGLLISNTFADETSTGTTSTDSVVTSTGTTDTNTGTTSTGTTDTGTGETATGSIDTSTGITSTGVINADKIKENIGQIKLNWAKFHEEYGFIKQFLKKPTTKEEAKTLAASVKADLKAYHDAVKALIKEGHDALKANTFDPVVFNTKASEVFTKNVENLTKYIDPAKTDAFKKFMDEKKAVIIVNTDLRKENFQLRKENTEAKKKMFSDKQKQAITGKLAKKDKNYLERLLKVIDVYSAKSKSEKLKSQLDELKSITQEIIDASK